MKIKIKKIGTKMIVGTLIGLIFMSAIASKQGYVAKAVDPKPAAPAIVCPSPFTASADGFSCEATINNNGKITAPNGGDIEAKCPAGFNTTSQSTTLVCTKAVKSMANADDLMKRASALMWIQGALNRLIWPVLVLIGGLMDNDLLFGNGMEERLREIWIPIRNLVNILFVILLVGIALYNVLGIGEESGNTSLKSVLPKIIIGIIAINFSFLAIKVFLDAVNVLTTSVFALPGQVSEGLALLDAEGKDKETIKKLCQSSFSGMSSQDFKSMTDEQMISKNDTQIYIDAFNKVKSKYPLTFKSMDESLKLANSNDNSLTVSSGDTPEKIQGKIEIVSKQNPAIKTEFNKDVQASKSGMICLGSELSSQGRIFLKRFNSSNAAFAMALLLGKIVYYEDLKFDALANIEKVAFNALFSMIFYLVYAASFVALLIVLLARLVIMWISIALSPILILALASSTVKEKLGGFSKLTEQFTKMAIAPLIIALTMAIGWIMLRAIQSINMFDSGSSLSINVSNGIPVVGLSTIQDLVVALGTIAIVWLGVFGAAEGTIAEKLTGTMKDWLQTAGSWVGKLPFRHIPFVPISIPGKEGEGPQHFTGAEVTQALGDIFHEGSRPQERLSEALGIGRTGKEDLRDVGTKEELYQHFNRKSVNDMVEDSYVRDLERWKRDHKDEFEEIRRKDPTLAGAITSLIEAGNKEDREDAAETIKGRNDVRNASASTAGATPATQEKKPEEGAYKPVEDKSEIGGRAIEKIVPNLADREPAIEGYNQKGSELSGNIDKLMKTHKDGKDVQPDETQKLIAALQGLRLLGIAPIERELRKQIGTKKVDYLISAIGNGDVRAGKNQLDAALGQPPAPPASGSAPPPAGP